MSEETQAEAPDLDTGPWQVSPSQVDTWLLCKRKWAWRYIGGLKPPPKPSAALGTEVHDNCLTPYLKDGKPLDFISFPKAANIAASGLHLLPAPKTVRTEAAVGFTFEGVRWRGSRDFCGFPSTPFVGDHKTTKSVKNWAKSVEELKVDSQVAVYGWQQWLDVTGAIGKDPGEIHFRWVYYQTEGANLAIARDFLLTTAHLAKKVSDLSLTGAEIIATKGGTTKPTDLPPNPSACRAFGGCPYEGVCNLSPAERGISAFAGLSPAIRQGNQRMLTVQELLKRAAPTAPMPTTTQAPAATLAPIPVVDVAPPPTTETHPGHPADTTPINPPESKLAPIVQPVVEAIQASTAALEAEKPKRKRRTKAEMAAARAAEAAAQSPLSIVAPAMAAEPVKAGQALILVQPPEAPATSPQELPVVAPAPTPAPAATPAPSAGAGGFTLYVNCQPSWDTYDAGQLVEAAHEQVKQLNKVADYRLIPYQGAGCLVAQFFQLFDAVAAPGQEWTLDATTPEGALVLQGLRNRAARKVVGR